MSGFEIVFLVLTIPFYLFFQIGFLKEWNRWDTTFDELGPVILPTLIYGGLLWWVL